MKGREAGYTLLEMLVALVVFGLVMLGVAQGLRFGLAAFTASGARGLAPANLAALDAALSRLVSEAVPGSLQGEAAGLAFTTRLPPGAGVGGGLADATIRLGAGGELLLLYRQHPPGPPLRPLPPPRREVLARNVTALVLSYYGAAPRQAPAWNTRWAQEVPPLLLRLHIATPGRDWPDLVIAPDPQGG
ncbi:PulJ/GspJ family protein [Acidisoma sp. 7E03]